MLYQTVMDARSGSQEAAEYLVGQFSPLLHSYAKKLHREDAFEDIRCDFWEIIMQAPLDKLRTSDDYTLLSYFAKAIRSRFIKRLDKQLNEKGTLSYSDLLDQEKYKIECATAVWDDYSHGLFQSIKGILNEKEYEVIYALYYHNISVPDLAEKLSVSRQNINQIKNRALKKLNTAFTSDT
ncbi:sigma-70 family RNA polymerase sigma factor [Butyricicoccus sp. 1XD8-22]|nr:sigma-70 family RNA polymerase sigma factor [Butyricicoccus sp. 1XD8-22]